MKRASSSSVEGKEPEQQSGSTNSSDAADRATATAPAAVKKQKVMNDDADDDNHNDADDTHGASPRQEAEKKEEKIEEETKEEAEKEVDEASLLEPQLELMPLIPAQPPTVPLTDEEEVELQKKYRYKYQTRPAPVYKSKDYALWPGKLPQAVFGSQKNIHNAVLASDYMRTWFAQYQGLRTPPPKAARSSYALYYNTQKTHWKDTHGKWNQKRDSKKIGVLWQNLAVADKAIYEHQYTRSHEQYTINTQYWHDEAAKWRTAKIQQLVHQANNGGGGGEGGGSSLELVEQQVTALIEAISRD